MNTSSLSTLFGLVVVSLTPGVLGQVVLGQDSDVAGAQSNAPDSSGINEYANKYTVDGIGGRDEDAGLAIVDPDEYAWRLFAELNQPSGEGDGTVVWENWALARLVYDDPNIKKDDMKWENYRTPATNKRTDRFDSLPIQQQILRAARENKLGHSLSRRQLQSNGVVGFDPNLAGVGGGDPENDEVRMNHSAFTTVRDQELYSVDGQEAAFEKNEPIVFDSDAKEIKAEWRDITDQPEGIQDTFHTATFDHDGETQVWGLVALHITTKDLPNWFWATWEHKSTSQRESVVPSRDRWGARLKYGSEVFDVQERMQGKEKGDVYPAGEWDGPSSALETLLDQRGLDTGPWHNYVLRGTQIDFTDKFGQPTILANSVIEEGFQDTSSCITCHAKAGIGPRLRRSDEKNRLPVFASDDPPVGDIGVPDPKWFFGASTSPANRKYLPLDFVWSTIRAKRKGPAQEEAQAANANPLIGKWTYQAFADNPNVVADPDIRNKVLGTGVLTITSADDGQLKGTLDIYESTIDDYWKLDVSGSYSRKGDTWLLEYLGVGASPENAPESHNFWLYKYENVRSVDGKTFVGRVRRKIRHLAGGIAKRLREESPSGHITAEQVKDLGDDAYYPGDQTGSFSMNKQ